MSTNSRRKAREIALKSLYQVDIASKNATDSLKDVLSENSVTEKLQIFATELVNGVIENKKQIDELIEKYADDYSLDRMAAIDRNLLRIAFFEILNLQDVPPAVAINEAVDLAKKFSTEESGAYINGILGNFVVESGIPTHGNK